MVRKILGTVWLVLVVPVYIYGMIGGIFWMIILGVFGMPLSLLFFFKPSEFPNMMPDPDNNPWKDFIPFISG